MPRGRPRKPRLSRMDAAVDAMVPFGFPEEIVRKHVKELLKEYGGDEGWPFIEEYSYKELIEAILRDAEVNDQEKVAEDGRSKDKLLEEERAAGSCSRVSDTQQDGTPQDNITADIAGSSGEVAEPTCSEVVRSSSEINNAEEDGKGWKDILPDEHSAEAANLVSKNGEDRRTQVNSPRKSSSSLNNNFPSQSLTTSLPTRRHLPCYGWIESDEEDGEDDFIYLRLASASVGAKATPLSDGTKLERKRKSRWDEKPDDP